MPISKDSPILAVKPEEDVFDRKSTGLTREVSLFDAFIMNTLGMNVAVGAVFLFLQAQTAFPRGSMNLAVVHGTVLVAFTLLWVYSEFAAAMPRSGGDYVFVSRALHPFWGFLMSWSQGIWMIFFWIGFNAWFALTFAVPVSLTTIGTVTGQPVWINLSNSLLSKPALLGVHMQWWVLLFGTIITVGFGALLVGGAVRYWRLQKLLFVIAGASLLVSVLLLAIRGGQLSTSWNSFASTTGGAQFDQIIPLAAAAGYHSGGGFSLYQTLLMFPWVFFVVGSAQGSAQIGGEVKNAARNQYIAMFGGVLVNGAVLAFMSYLITSRVSSRWLGSLGYLANAEPAKLGLPGNMPPGFNFIAALLTHNVFLLALMGVGFMIWAVMGTPLSELQATRYMLAWSLDRQVPHQLGEVSERFHTPVKAIIFCTITGELSLFLLVNVANASLLGALLGQILVFILVCLAGVMFPYRLTDVWKSAGGRRIAGIPLVTLAGGGGVLVLGSLLTAFIFNNTINSTFAVTRGLSLVFMSGVVVTGVLWYWGAQVINRRRGFDPKLVFKEIPPE